MRTLSDFAKVYKPAYGTPVKGVLQIVHGMCEHQLRYTALAEYLSENGYVVVTSDLRGHGDNIRRSGELGYFGDNAVSNLVGDIHDINLYIKDEYPGVPCVLLGHSMGTLVSISYFKKYDNFVDGLILSGLPTDNPAKGVAKLMIKAIEGIKGEYYRSKFINNLVNGPFSKAFPNEESQFAWLASDSSVWEAYEADPKCGYIFTLNGFYTLMELMENVYGSSTWIKKNTDIPVRFMSGEKDPCMGNKAKLLKAVDMFKAEGYTDVSYKLYKNQRHEIFNDADKAFVWSELLDILDMISEKHSR